MADSRISRTADTDTRRQDFDPERQSQPSSPAQQTWREPFRVDRNTESTPPRRDDNYPDSEAGKAESDAKPLKTKQEDEDEDKDEDEESNSIHSQRAVWGNQIEFLMSCIATSVGLGNVWRFPFVAYENGGGAFLIPYIIVLFLVGKPLYYLECVLGQFSTRNSISVWALAPAMKGTGFTQTLVCGYVLSYYVPIVAMCLYYFAKSFQPVLPWTLCEEGWTDCVPSDPNVRVNATPNASSSAELYFLNRVLRLSDGVEGALSLPLWDLSLCLLAIWIIVYLVIARGVKSSGKASYFLALFPYLVMIVLLISISTLPGSGDGILFFLTPQWNMLRDINVWYAAITQIFFSLSVSTGAIIMFSSYNNFRQNVYRDAMIVTTLDTFTSLLSGITIFGILGNLAFELQQPIRSVVGSGGVGLAFISYPDAIAKTFMPQLFAVLFFLMMLVLGIGSAVALMSTINTVLLDALPKVRANYTALLCCSVGFICGLVYVTPGGQYVLTLVDHFGGTFLALFAGLAEILSVFWLYGLENVTLDIEFMMGIKTSFYWRLCWSFVAPVMMIIVFCYALISTDEVTYGENYHYPFEGFVAGYMILGVGIFFVPLVILITLFKNRSKGCKGMLAASFNAKENWGPQIPELREEWKQFKQRAKQKRRKVRASCFEHICLSLSGDYRRGK